ncbi:MAG: tetratricopeptide repeat protein [Candidatus Omnitrophica bacterium]|nr:tetratricopeptide repeat protein [Candidatus Omnitrophota bacterium]
MSEAFLKKLNFLAGFIALLVLLGLVIFEANIEIKDLDLWLHLASGKYIVQHASIPKVDIFSCSLANRPWLNHEWLFQTIVYQVHRFSGFDGLIDLQVGVVFLTFLLLVFLGFRSKNQLLPLAFLILVLLTFETRLTIRPDIFSFLFMTIYLVILIAPAGLGALAVLFLIQVLWTNIHGFFILGPLIILLGIAAEYVRRHVRLPYDWNATGKLSDKDYNFLKKAFVLVFLACFINPYGLKGVCYPFSVLMSLHGETKVFFDQIVELAKPITFKTLFSFHPYWYFRLAILVSLASFIANRRKINIGILALWLVFLCFGLNALRNLVFFLLIAYVAFLSNLGALNQIKILQDRIKLKYILSAALKIVLVCWMINYFGTLSMQGYFDFDTFERKSEFGGVSKRLFPYKAVDFLASKKIQGNFFNQFNSGAYLLGRTSPRIKVFIDGRTELYGPKFFKEYDKICHGDKLLFDRDAKRYQLTGVFLNWLYDLVPERLLRSLYQDKNWKLVYFDYDGVVFLKDVAQNQKWISAYQMDLKNWKVPELDLLKVGARSVLPYQYLNRANAFLALGLWQQAKAEAEESLRIDPGIVEAYKILGRISLKEKRYKDAFVDFRKAKLLDPNNLETRYYLSKGFYYLDAVADAKKQVSKIVTEDPHNFKALYLMALVLIKEKKYDKAFDAIDSAYHSAPFFVDDLVEIGDALVLQKRFALAKKVYGMVLKEDPGNEKIRQEMRALSYP